MEGPTLEFTALNAVSLIGYIAGAVLLAYGGNGILRDLTARRQMVANAGSELLNAGVDDLTSLSRSLDIHREMNEALARQNQARAEGGPDALAKVLEEVKTVQRLSEEMRLQGARSDSATARITPAMDEMKEALYEPLADDVRAVVELQRKYGLARKEKFVTLSGLILTTIASCVSLFIP